MNRKKTFLVLSTLTLILFMVIACSSNQNKPSETSKEKKCYTYVIHYNTEITNDTVYTNTAISVYFVFSERDYFIIKDTNGFTQWFNKFNITKVERIP